MAKQKSYTAAEYRAKLDDEMYSVPEIAARWHKHPSEVCRIMEAANAKPHRYESHGWVYWQFSGHAVYCAEEGHRVLFS